jgi:hypothetical protein
MFELPKAQHQPPLTQPKHGSTPDKEKRRGCCCWNKHNTLHVKKHDDADMYYYLTIMVNTPIYWASQIFLPVLFTQPKRVLGTNDMG